MSSGGNSKRRNTSSPSKRAMRQRNEAKNKRIKLGKLLRFKSGKYRTINGTLFKVATQGTNG